MKAKKFLSRVLLIGLPLALAGGMGLVLAQGPGPQGPLIPQEEVGTAFTYQGRLTDASTPVDGACDFRFALWNASTGGSQVALGLEETNVPMTGGLFTANLDFGSGVFNGEARWLAVAVRCPAGNGDYVNLFPRQALTPAPYALALPGLWTQQNITSTNLIGGYSGNVVTAGVTGATIGGGGNNGSHHHVTDNYGTVGGGLNNQAGDNAGTTEDKPYATVGGGVGNIASGYYATVAGGHNGTANADETTVGGGRGNAASGERATVSGGWGNEASGYVATVGGGGGNTASGNFACAAGGNHNTASGVFASVGGGELNTASGYVVTIGGGHHNQAAADYATIAGGGSGQPALGNRVTDEYGAVGGGYNNQAGDGAGTTDDRSHATVGGGCGNTASGISATVGGGHGNTASGGFAAVGGGFNNTASGYQAVIPGGGYNIAQGQWTLAAGQHAQANAKGCFVWGDSSTVANVTCDIMNRWVARASGGVYFYTNSGLTSGMYLSAGGSSWNAVSDRERKENFAPVDAQELLERLAETPVTTWNYKSQDPTIRHVGPMAQDFNVLIEGLGGEGEDYINTLDADGVALAAIQGLYAQNQALQAENTDLQQQVDDLEARVVALEAAVGNAAPARRAQSSLLPGAGVLLTGLGLVWVARRGGGR